MRPPLAAVFLLSLFGTNMTAFTILGSAGHAFANGIVTFPLMASSSAVVIPLTLFFVGTRVWAPGKRHGFITPVQMFRYRWECAHIDPVTFAVPAALPVHIIIGVMGGGTALPASPATRPMLARRRGRRAGSRDYVFFGGMRGCMVSTFRQSFSSRSACSARYRAAWVGWGGHGRCGVPTDSAALTRERISPLFFLSYRVPLSRLRFASIFCYARRRRSSAHGHRYPICILAIWLPCVFLGVAANACATYSYEEKRLAESLAAAPAV